MTTNVPGPPSSDPWAAGFEHAAEPAFVTEGARHRIVAINAAARAQWGEAALGAELATALPTLEPEQVDCWSWVLQSQTPTQVPGALGSRGGSAVLDLRPWPGADGRPRGVVAHLSQDLPGGLVATRMQEALLPEELPVLPRLDLAATYLLADGADGAAGDWFDTLLTPAGTVALVVGDVAGRGTEAVATMATLRAVLHERLVAGCSAGDALAAVDGLVTGLPRLAATTVVLAIVEPETGELTYCTAGHPAPLVVDPDDGARRLPSTGAAALGVGSTYPTLAHTLEPGQMLALHSDSARAAKRSDRPVGELMHAVVRSLGGGHGIRGTVDRVCERVLADVIRGGSPDDVVLLAAERMPSAQQLELHLPATAGAVREARVRLGDWLDDLRPGELDVSALLHAAGELVSNAVEHAYVDHEQSGTDAVVVRAHLSAVGEVALSVHDGGRWRPADERAGRGCGLVMAAGLVDRLELDRRDEGTVATIRHRIGRPVTMFRSPPSVPAVGRRAGLDVTAAGPGRVLVGGQVDEDAAGELRVALLHHTRVGTAPLVVDLSGTALLTSAGVRVLAEALGWGTGSVGLSLVAAPGSVAQQVLGAAGVPCSAA